MVSFLSILTVTTLVAGPSTSWTQNQTPEFELLTLADGLSDSTIFSIDQDSEGRIWFGTASGGANVFDGHTLRAFGSSPSDGSLSHSAAGQVFVDSRGTLYVGTWGGGLNRLVSPEGRFERINPEQPPLRIQTIFEDLDNRLWIGAAGDGLMLFDGDSEFTPVPRADGQPLERVWDIAQGPDAKLWVAAQSGLYALDGDLLELESVVSFEQDQPRALTLTSDQLWIGGNSGIYTLDLETHTIDRLPVVLPTVNVLRRSSERRVLIGTLAGLFAIDPTSGSLVPAVEGARERLFPDRNIRDIDFDRTGMIWLATREAGVIKLIGQRTGFDGFDTGSKLETVDTLLELADDQVLIGSRRGLWLLQRTPQGADLEQVEESQSLFVNQLAMAHGRVLVATRSGLYVYDSDRRSLTVDAAFSDLAGVSITVVQAAQDGSLWIGTWARGLFHLTPEGAMVRYWTGGTPSLPDDYLSTIIPDRDGGLWLGHWYEGLSRLDTETGELEHFQSNREDVEALPLGHVHSLALDREAIWVGTSFGFGRLDLSTRRVTRIPVSSYGLPTSVQRLELDARGNVWIATTRGLKRLDHSSGRLVHYGAADGLAVTEFYARSGARGENGRIYFGGVGGLVSFDPLEVDDQFEAPEIFVTEAHIDSSAVGLGDGKIAVPPGSRELRVVFSAADFKDPKENRYQYRLLGDSEEWSPASADNDTIFAALPPGNYTLEVRAGNSNGVWNVDHPARVEITVFPFWWQTFGGRFGIALGLILMVYSWHLVRTRRIRAANRRLEAEVARQTGDLKKANHRLARAAATDFLTGLPNRRGFYAKLSSDEEKVRGTVALADVDDFKLFNDRFGHDLGDLVLKNVADAIATAVRPQDLVARWGGEEFIFFFEQVDLDAAEVIAERVRETVAAMNLENDLDNRPVSITVGIAERDPQETLHQCIDRADQVLYAGKQAGKNRVVKAA